jgi:hypothetical protein
MMGWLLAVLGSIFGALLLGGLIQLVQTWRRRRRRILWEDALKQIFSAKQEGRLLTSADIAGRLGLSQSSMLRLARALESAGWVRSRADVLEPTEKGERLGALMPLAIAILVCAFVASLAHLFQGVGISGPV